MMAETVRDDWASDCKDREDSNAKPNNRFETFQLDVKCLDTAIFLLGSQERSVLVAAASALTKFAAEGKENLEKLFELEIVDSLIPLIDHADIAIRRFASRLLTEMTAIPFVKTYLLESDDHLPKFVKIHMEDPDILMQEYASRMLAELSGDPYGAAKILEHCDSFDFIFQSMTIADPNVKKNNIEIVDNLLKDLIGPGRIIESQGFNFESICQLLAEPYPKTQALALSTLESLLLAQKQADSHVQQLFRQSGALDMLLDLLNDVDLVELHSPVLRVINAALENPENQLSLVSTGISKLFQYFERQTSPRELRDILEVLVHLANTESGRESLHNFQLVKHLCGYLRDNQRDQDIIRIACLGIGITSGYGPAATEEIIQQNSTKSILDILINESMNRRVRQAAVFALRELCKNDKRIRHNFQEIKGPVYLKNFLKQNQEKFTVEMQIMAIEILKLIGEDSELRKRLVDAVLIDALCASFGITNNRSIDELKIAACRALPTFCEGKNAREICLMNKNFLAKLFELLRVDQSIPVRAAAAQLVQHLSNDPTMAQELLQAGFLNYMLEHRAISNIVPTWKTCIDSLLSAHLPFKFALRGRISFNDITNDGFYVMRPSVLPFPTLDDLLHAKIALSGTVYVVNFVKPRSTSRDEKTSPLAKSRNSSTSSSNSKLETEYGKLYEDPCLYEQLETFKNILAANEHSEIHVQTNENGKVIDIRKIGLRAKLLGIFVARRMSGPDPQNPCIDHQLEIHVREIQDAIGTCIIPLGHLRVGSYLERALLFKVLADKIFLPATLVRGEYGKAWNEIAIPEIENPVEDPCRPQEVLGLENQSTKMSTSDQQQKPEGSRSDSGAAFRDNSDEIHCSTDDNSPKIFFTNLLQKNYIVDLMRNPGNLIRVDSSQARDYCSCLPPAHKRM